MSHPAAPVVQRYVPAQLVIHWIGVSSFALLLASGSPLVIRPLAFLAAGGILGWVHRIAAIFFLGLPVAYAVLLPRAALEVVRDSLSLTRIDLAWLGRMPRYLLGSTRGLPPQGRLNAGQKIHHLGTFLAFATVSASGLVLWLGKGQLGPVGLAGAALVHDLSVLVLSVLALGHLYFTFLYDAFSAMRTGTVTEDYARSEHRAWFESLRPGPRAARPMEDAAPGDRPGGPQ